MPDLVFNPLMIITFIVVLALLVVRTGAQFDTKHEAAALLEISKKMGESGDGYIKKRQFSPTLRILFFAGLEGTGHHAWRKIIDVCVNKGLCAKDYELSISLMEHFASDRNTTFLGGLFGASDVEYYPRDLSRAYNRMRALSASTGGSHLYVVGFNPTSAHGGTSSTGMMSYPNFNGINKPLNNPDVHILAAVTEAAGVDLRVIVLQRGAAAILRSDTEHRHFGSDVEPRVLMVSAEELSAQLSLMDRNFFTCVDFETMTAGMTTAESTALANFMHPKVVPMWPEMISVFRKDSSMVHNEKGSLSGDIAVAVMTANNSTSADFAALTLSNAYNVMQLRTRTSLINRECSRLDS